MAGAFQTDSYWFLLDNDEDAEVEWEDGPGTDEDFGQRLTNSGRLPELGGAPLASWVAARLAWRTGGLPAWACDQQVDEGAYRLGLLVFNHDRAHLGRVNVVADRSGVSVCCASPAPARILAELASALLSAPADVAECRIEVRKPEDEAECRLEGREPDSRAQAVYGYERGAYLVRVVAESGAAPDRI